MRIMALDLGEKRVGVAVSDELGITAGPLTVLNRRPHQTFLQAVSDLYKEYGVEKIILGLPRNMDGSLGPQAQRVLAMVNELKKIGLNVDTWDERLSTVAAERVLLEADLSRQKRKQVIDKVAAAYILQGYLDSIKNN
jgi:putative Holliday junction resolvase